MLLIRRSPILKRSSGARLFDCLLISLIDYIQQNGVIKLIPTLSFKRLPLLLNVVHWHWYFSKSC